MSEGLEIVTPPALYPVTVQEAKDHCNVEHDEDDALIAELIRAATEWAEAMQGRAYGPTTYRQHLDRFPACVPLRLPRAPVLAVTQIEYVDNNGTAQILAPAKYKLNRFVEPAQLWPAYNETWPETRPESGAVRVTFTAGYVTDLVPKTTKQAILLQIGAWYAHREELISGTIISQLPGHAGAENLIHHKSVAWSP